MLIPNKKQRTKLVQCAHTARYAYNWALRKEVLSNEKGRGFLKVAELKKQFSSLRKAKGYEWLLEVPEEVTRQAIKEAVNAYKNYIHGETGCPRFKKKQDGNLSFYLEGAKITGGGRHIQLEGLFFTQKEERNRRSEVRIKCYQKIPMNAPCHNARIYAKEGNWYIKCYVLEEEEWKQSFKTESQKEEEKEPVIYVGKKEGIKEEENAFGEMFCEPDFKAQKLKKLKKRKERMIRSIQRKYEKNKKGDTYQKTRNIIKKEAQLVKINRRIEHFLRDSG